MGKKKRKLQDSPRADIGAEIAPSSPDTLGGQTPQPPQYISPPDYDPLNDCEYGAWRLWRRQHRAVSIPLHADPIIPNPTYSFTGGAGQRTGVTLPTSSSPDFGTDVIPSSALIAAWGTVTPNPTDVANFQSSYNANLSPEAQAAGAALAVTGITDAKTLAAMGVPGFGCDITTPPPGSGPASVPTLTDPTVVAAANVLMGGVQTTAAISAFQNAWNAVSGSTKLPTNGTLDATTNKAFQAVVTYNLFKPVAASMKAYAAAHPVTQTVTNVSPTMGVEAANTAVQQAMNPPSSTSIFNIVVGAGVFFGLLYLLSKIDAEANEPTGRTRLIY